MRQNLSFLMFLVAFFSLSNIQAQSYTWIGANNASWTTVSNWNPSRNSPGSNDALTINTNVTITNLPSTQTIGRLTISGTNTSVTLIATSTTALTIGNQSGDDLIINSGNTLILNNNVSFILPNDAIANIQGTLTMSTSNTISGLGDFQLNSNATLKTANPGGVSATITTSGGDTEFDDDANYEFNSTTAAQSTGFTNINNQARNITNSNTFGTLTLDRDFTINRTLTLNTTNNKEFNISSRLLTFDDGNTPIVLTSGTITTNSSTDLRFRGSGSTFTIPNNVFTSNTPSFDDITIDRDNQLTWNNQNPIVNGTLILENGVFNLPSTTFTFQVDNTPLSRNNGSLTMSTSTNFVFGTSGNVGGSAITIPSNFFTSNTPNFGSLTLNRTNGLTWNSQNPSINGTLTLTLGTLNMSGRTVTFQTGDTPISRGSGTMTVSSSSNLIFGTSGNTGGNAATIPDNTFTSAPSINNFTINRNNKLTWGNQDLTLVGTLTLTKGVLSIPSAQKLILPASSTTLGNASSFVEGNVSITTNTNNQALNFPLGRDTWWNPLKLTTNGFQGGSGTSTTFVCNYTNASKYSTPLPSGISTVMNIWWDINRTAGNRNVNMQLYWNGNLGNIQDRSKLRILHGNGTSWDDLGTLDNSNGNNASGGAGSNSAGSIIKNSVNNFSPFTIGSTDPINSLPIHLLNFNARRMDAQQVRLTWQTATEQNNKGFDIEQSKDGLSFNKIGFVDGAVNSTSVKSYELKVNSSKSAYYRLKQIDLDGSSSYSKIEFVSRIDAQAGLVVYPNPVVDRIKFQFNQNNPQETVQVRLQDIQGKLIWELRGQLEEVETALNQNLTNLKFEKGILILHLQSPSGSFVKRLIKN